MPKINLNTPIFNLQGEPLPGAGGKTIGSVIAELLAGANVKGLDAIRYWDWATNLSKDVAIVLSEVDATTLKTFIEQHESMTVLLKAQALARIKECEQNPCQEK